MASFSYAGGWGAVRRLFGEKKIDTLIHDPERGHRCMSDNDVVQKLWGSAIPSVTTASTTGLHRADHVPASPKMADEKGVESPRAAAGRRSETPAEPN